ncbi:MAG: hypothetical protein J2P55_00040 [Rhizobiales bacterium]|nr:hypothetical protein [Hyphomicrobiales bacterium]
MRKSKAERIADDRIGRAYYGTCSGIAINILDIPRVFAEGRRAIAQGADDAQLAAAIFGFVSSIAKAA